MKTLSGETRFSEAIGCFVKGGRSGKKGLRTGRDYAYHLKAFQSWVYDKLISERTARLKKSANRKIPIIVSLEALKIRDISPQHVREYLHQTIRQGKSPATANTRLYTLKSLYKFLNNASGGKIPDNIRNIPRVALQPSQPDYLPFAKRETLTRHLYGLPENNPLHFRNKMLFLTMLKFGLTVSETLSLKKEDFRKNATSLDLIVKGHRGRTRTLTLLLAEREHMGRGKHRMVPVSGNIAYSELLERYFTSDKGLSWFKITGPDIPKKGPGHELPLYLFQSRRCQILSHDSVRELFIALTRELGWEKEGFTPKTLRGTAIANWLFSGVSLEDVSRLAGHASVAVTEHALQAIRRKKGEQAVPLPF
jgi:site-specific recombinase XerD